MTRLFAAALLGSLILAGQAPAEIIHLHAKRGNLKGVLAELDKGVPLEIRSTSMTSAPGVTPLFVAAKFGRTELVKELLARGADPTLFFSQPDGRYTAGTALHQAAGYGHLEVARVLIEAGADPANYEPFIATPLHQALRGGHSEVAELLIEAEAPQIVESPSIVDMIGDADLKKGKFLVDGCVFCHGVPSSLRPVGDNGPNLWGLYDQPAASDPNFQYSDFLKKRALVWDADSLNSYLASPYQFVPGTSKIMIGISDAADRAAIIAYLATLKD